MAAINKFLLFKNKMLLMLLRSTVNRNRIRKKIWVRQIFQERETKGELHMLIKDLRSFDKEYSFRNFRMNPATFESCFYIFASHH